MISELEALVILTLCPHLGAVKIRQLVEKFGSAQAALDVSPAAIAKIPEFGPKIANVWRFWKKDEAWKQNIELANKHRAAIIPYTHPQYPKRLLEISDHPVLLYVHGELSPADQNCIAVVGTRQASIYGKEMAETISRDLAAAGFTVVSGLARGIDTAAHHGALTQGRTVAVIGSGLTNIYPQENSALGHAIAKKGALISEFPMATPPDRQNFPQRNRIVSGMTLGTLLIEAPIKSGAMITMEKAMAHKRPLFALPGRADSADFKGNHMLIKTRQATLVENARDIISHFEDLFALMPTALAPQKPRASLTAEETKFLALLPEQELSIDEIVNVTQLPITRVNVMLINLVIKKIIKEFPGKVFKKST